MFFVCLFVCLFLTLRLTEILLQVCSSQGRCVYLGSCVLCLFVCLFVCLLLLCVSQRSDFKFAPLAGQKTVPIKSREKHEEEEAMKF